MLVKSAAKVLDTVLLGFDQVARVPELCSGGEEIGRLGSDGIGEYDAAD